MTMRRATCAGSVTVRGLLPIVQDAWGRLSAGYVPIVFCTISASISNVSLCFCSLVVGRNICIVCSILTPSIPALRLRPPRSHLCVINHICCQSQAKVHEDRELLYKWRHSLTGKPALNFCSSINVAYTRIFEMAVYRSLGYVYGMYLLAMLTEIYQMLSHRAAEVLNSYMMALVSLRIFGSPPLPAHREGY